MVLEAGLHAIDKIGASAAIIQVDKSAFYIYVTVLSHSFYNPTTFNVGIILSCNETHL